MLRFETKDARSARDYADIQETYHTSALQEIIGLFGNSLRTSGTAQLYARADNADGETSVEGFPSPDARC